ncbi:MAG: hypothetical protein AB1832_13330 [Pseudomonadota bacterium]
MTDTIDLLDTIGQDATLRHASQDDLVQALEHAGASAALKEAAAKAEKAPLRVELGPSGNEPPQVINSPAHEEEPEEEETEIPSRPTPDRGQPSQK